MRISAVRTVLATLSLCVSFTNAVLPAQPASTVDASKLIDTSSTLRLTWYPFGTFDTSGLAYRHRASLASDGRSEGAFTRFAEANASAEANDYTTTPWIAFVTCDYDPNYPSNTTEDTFTLAKRRGAVAILLYSMMAPTCEITAEFEPSLEKLQLDIFTTTSQQTAWAIDGAFINTNASFQAYNGAELNNSAAAVSQSLTSHNAREVSFLIATLEAGSAGAVPPAQQGAADVAARLTLRTGLVLSLLLTVSAFCLF